MYRFIVLVHQYANLLNYLSILVGMAQNFPKWILAAEGAGEPELRPMFNSASYGEEEGWVKPNMMI